jgi:hypothetical protein
MQQLGWVVEKIGFVAPKGGARIGEDARGCRNTDSFSDRAGLLVSK